MKNILVILLVALTIGATAQIQTPPASPSGSVFTKVGLTDIKIEYSRPKMKGRKVFGEGADFLVPFGKIWRTGANGGTTISFSDDVKIENIAVPQGTYLIVTWPAATEWTVALYKDVDLGGNMAGYDQTKEQARFKAKVDKIEKVETFTMAIGDLSDDNTSGKVQIAWENTSAKFGVTVDYEKKIKAALEATSIVAAQYYFESKKDAKKALPYINDYFASGTHEEEFWNILLKAQIQKAAGDKAGATASAQKSLSVAKKNNNDVYVKRNEDLLKELGTAK